MGTSVALREASRAGCGAVLRERTLTLNEKAASGDASVKEHGTLVVAPTIQ
jgi:hypothetical protein